MDQFLKDLKIRDVNCHCLFVDIASNDECIPDSESIDYLAADTDLICIKFRTKDLVEMNNVAFPYTQKNNGTTGVISFGVNWINLESKKIAECTVIYKLPPKN